MPTLSYITETDPGFFKGAVAAPVLKMALYMVQNRIPWEKNEFSHWIRIVTSDFR